MPIDGSVGSSGGSSSGAPVHRGRELVANSIEEMIDLESLFGKLVTALISASSAMHAGMVAVATLPVGAVHS